MFHAGARARWQDHRIPESILDLLQRASARHRTRVPALMPVHPPNQPTLPAASVSASPPPVERKPEEPGPFEEPVVAEPEAPAYPTTWCGTEGAGDERAFWALEVAADTKTPDAPHRVVVTVTYQDAEQRTGDVSLRLSVAQATELAAALLRRGAAS